jgi:hypothetical protein
VWETSEKREKSQRKKGTGERKESEKRGRRERDMRLKKSYSREGKSSEKRV